MRKAGEPENQLPPPPPTEAQKKAAEEAMTKLAASLRARAAKGEDPDKLQKEAYVAAGLTGNPPTQRWRKYAAPRCLRTIRRSWI